LAGGPGHTEGSCADVQYRGIEHRLQAIATASDNQRWPDREIQPACADTKADFR
jgi:hypothetical protein